MKKAPELTEAEVLALPENGGPDDVLTHPQTGLSMPIRRPRGFLVAVNDVFVYHLSDGSHWFVGRNIQGKLCRERRNF